MAVLSEYKNNSGWLCYPIDMKLTICTFEVRRCQTQPPVIKFKNWTSSLHEICFILHFLWRLSGNLFIVKWNNKIRSSSQNIRISPTSNLSNFYVGILTISDKKNLRSDKEKFWDSGGIGVTYSVRFATFSRFPFLTELEPSLYPTSVCWKYVSDAKTQLYPENII